MMTADDGTAAGPDDLPIAIIGAGPIGLAMAAHLVGCGQPFVVLEAGPEAGHAIRQWEHVRLFTEWESNIDEEAERLLLNAGWQAPAKAAIPAGGELLRDYLAPLSSLSAIQPHLRFGNRVTAVTRRGLDKVKTEKRGERPFLLQVGTADGEHLIETRAVIDASGTWFANNPLHSAGIWTAAELAAAGRIRYGLPNVLGSECERYAGRTTAVVGSGYSAINVILALSRNFGQPSRKPKSNGWCGATAWIASSPAPARICCWRRVGWASACAPLSREAISRWSPHSGPRQSKRRWSMSY